MVSTLQALTTVTGSTGVTGGTTGGVVVVSLMAAYIGFTLATSCSQDQILTRTNIKKERPFKVVFIVMILDNHNLQIK